MSRVRSIVIALGVAFAVPALTGADVPPVTSSAPESLCAPPADSEYSDTRWLWRLRAYQHLDCVTEIVDRALAASSGDRIELRRADLERIRAAAWSARDAAARIGQ